jgi:hypothetical protein
MPSSLNVINPRLTFIGNFYGYNGLSLYYKALSKEANTSDAIKRAIKLMGKPMSDIESHLMQIYKCNPEFPICMYDFTFKNRNPN